MVPGLIAALLLLLPASAEAAKFEGQTRQGEPIMVRTNQNDEVTLGRVKWRTGNCSRPGWFLKRTSSWFVKPFDRSQPGFFVDRGQYRVRYEDARVRYRVSIRGRMRSERRWRGTLAAQAFLKFEDGGEMTCGLRRISWGAGLAP